MLACRQQHIPAEESCSSRCQEHIPELAAHDRDSQSQTQDVWVGSGQTQGTREAHRNIVSACLIKPGNTCPANGTVPINQPVKDLTSWVQRFPAASLAEQQERSSQSPAGTRRRQLA